LAKSGIIYVFKVLIEVFKKKALGSEYTFLLYHNLI